MQSKAKSSPDTILLPGREGPTGCRVDIAAGGSKMNELAGAMHLESASNEEIPLSARKALAWEAVTP